MSSTATSSADSPRANAFANATASAFANRYPSLPQPRLAHYAEWLARKQGLRFETYEQMWEWSVRDLDAFWESIWQYFNIQSPVGHTAVLAEERMPGAQWFPGAQLNFARQVFRHADAGQSARHPAIVFANESLLAQGKVREISWHVLRRQVSLVAHALERMGVRRGDRVCAVMPNVPQTVVAFLATASLGAIWSLCSPDMGPVAILDRFQQIEPRVLVLCDGYVWGGTAHDRTGLMSEVLQGLPSVEHVITWRNLQAEEPLGTVPRMAARPDVHRHDWQVLMTPQGSARYIPSYYEPVWLPFDHPLWVVYSSGTTGLPKPIVHGHGGIVMELLKSGVIHDNIGSTVATGDRFHWYSSTGWIMWNAQVGGLLGGTSICIFDGSPSGSSKSPDWTTLWRFASLAKVTFFGAGAAFYASCLKADVRPQEVADLSHLRSVGSTGSPLSEECHDWIWERLPLVDGQPIWLNTISGGTDFAGPFVAGNICLPMVRGEMQVRALGASVQAYSESGEPLMDEVGELVCTRPMPSMPLRFWNDEGDRRYIESYFDMYPARDGKPAAWRHGDWIKLIPHRDEQGRLASVGSIIYGRSDATINRHGIRMGTAELYRAVEALPEVLDSLVVDLEYLGRESYMPLFVVLREGLTLDTDLEQRIRSCIRQALSARHVPNEVLQVQAIPRTLSGKKMELPIKKLLLGASPESVMKRDAMANADSVDWFIEFARQRASA